MPLVRFLPQSPVYFDRHTLSLKDGLVSMFTLDGRMRFELALSKTDEQRFRVEKLREIVLTSRADVFSLSFTFATLDDTTEPDDSAVSTRRGHPQIGGKSVAVARDSTHAELPEYVIVIDEEAAPALLLPHPATHATQLPT